MLLNAKININQIFAELIWVIIMVNDILDKYQLGKTQILTYLRQNRKKTPQNAKNLHKWGLSFGFLIFEEICHFAFKLQSFSHG